MANNSNVELSSDTIRLAVPEMSPQKIQSIMKRYRYVLSSLPAAELQGAVDRTNFDKITKKLLSIDSTTGDQYEIDKRKKLISDFEKELTLLSSDLDLFNYEEAKAAFDQMDKLFKKYSINANMSDYMKTYLSLPLESRVPVCDIQDAIIKILSIAHEVWDKNILEVPSFEGTIFEQPAEEVPLLKRSELDNLFTILGMYCWGQKEKAEKEMAGLFDRLNFYKRCDSFRTDTGLNNLTNVDINGIFTALIKIGISKDKVDAYAVKEIKKIKALNKEHYEILASGMGSYELSGFLLASIAVQKETNTKKSKDALKVTLRVESELVLMNERVRKANEKNIAKLKESTDELTKYRNKPPRNVRIDSETIKLENDIASYRYEIALNEYAGLFAQVQHEIANSYLSKKSINLTSKKSKEFFEKLYSMNYKDDGGISDFTDFAKEFSLPAPPSLSFLVSTHLQVHALEHEWEVKKWYASHPKYAESLNDFYDTGKVSPKNRDILLESLDFEAQHVEKIIERFTAESVDAADFYESVRFKHANINELSPEKAMEVSVKISGYLMLLNNLRGLNAKLLGIYNSFEYIGKGLVDSKKRIAELKDLDSKYISKIEDIAHFTNQEEKITVPDLELYAESPLYKPLLQKEFGPIFKNVEDQFKENVIPAQEKIAGIDPQLKYWAKQSDEQMRTHGFNVADQYFGDALAWLRKARTNISAERRKLVEMLDDDGPFKDMPKAMKLLRIKLIRQSIDRLDVILDNEKSVLSMLGINRLVTARAGLKEDAENFYFKGLSYGIAIAIVIAASIGFAVAGGYAFAALGAWAFGGMTATIGSVAVADLAIGFTTMVGVSAGGVLGSRLGMTATQATGMADWKGYGEIWAWKRLVRDFGIALALNILAVGAAKFIVGSLKWGAGLGFSGKAVSARSARFASRFPRLANISRRGLKTMKIISEVASPSGWFRGGGEEATKKGILRQFGARFVEETAEEGAETAAEAADPILLGPLFTIANASDGCDVNTSLRGIRAADIGIVIEGKSLAYTTATAEKFVSNLRAKFSDKKGIKFNTAIKDGVVTIDFLTTNAKGKTERTFIDVQPAQLSTNLSVDVEISRISGLEVDENGEYFVKSSNGLLSSLSGLRSRNFAVTRTAKGFKAVKGDYTLEFSVDPEIATTTNIILASFASTLPSITNILNKFLNNKKLTKQEAGELEFKMNRTANSLASLGIVTVPAGAVDVGTKVVEIFGAVAIPVLDIAIPAFIAYGALKGGVSLAFKRDFSQFTNAWKQLRAGNLADKLKTEIDTKLQGTPDRMNVAIALKGQLSGTVWHHGGTLADALSTLGHMNKEVAQIEVNKIISNLNRLANIEDTKSQQFQNITTEINESFDKLATIPKINLGSLTASVKIVGIYLLYLILRGNGIITPEKFAKLVMFIPRILSGEKKKKGGKKEGGGEKPIEDPFGGAGVVNEPSIDSGAKKGPKTTPSDAGAQEPVITPVTPGKKKGPSSKSSFKEAIDIYKGGKKQKGAKKKKAPAKRPSGSKKAGRFEDVDFE